MTICRICISDNASVESIILCYSVPYCTYTVIYSLHSTDSLFSTLPAFYSTSLVMSEYVYLISFRNILYYVLYVNNQNTVQLYICNDVVR